MPVKIHSLLEGFPSLVQLARGSKESEIRALAAPENALPEDLIFVADLKHFREAEKSAAKNWLVSPELVERVPSEVHVVLTSRQVQLSMAQIGHKFFPINARDGLLIGEKKIHPTAQIASTARLGE